MGPFEYYQVMIPTKNWGLIPTPKVYRCKSEMDIRELLNYLDEWLFCPFELVRITNKECEVIPVDFPLRLFDDKEKGDMCFYRVERRYDDRWEPWDLVFRCRPGELAETTEYFGKLWSATVPDDIPAEEANSYWRFKRVDYVVPSDIVVDPRMPEILPRI